jgi:hypothetical protein
MVWLYKKSELTDEMIPAKAAGFIYMITHKPSGRKYIGRKLLTKAHRRQQNKKIIRTRVESDWREYWSSSPEVKALVESEGADNFVREILLFADTKGQLNYLEEKFLYCVGALESEDWFNSNIRSKMYKRNIIGKLPINDIDSIILQYSK